MRRLLVTRRQMALDRSDGYDHAWQRLRDAVATASGRAWRYQGAERQDQFLEFIEWKGGSDFANAEPIARRRLDVDAIAPGSSELWNEAAEQST